MIREFFMFVAWSTLIGLSVAFDDIKKVPICENKSPRDIYFDLSKMGLTTVRKSFVSSPSVTCINLENNNIENLEQGAFDGLPELHYLNLARNLVSFEDFMNMTFPKLRTLILDQPGEEGFHPRLNPTSDYYTKYISYAPSYKRRIDKISAIFVPELEKLSFCNHPYPSSVEKWLHYFSAPNLTHLYIAGNRLNNLIFPEEFTQTITHLNMDNNNIFGFVTTFPKLRYLSIDDNEISKICNVNCDSNSLSLRDMFDLEYLSIMNNRIETVESDAFEDSENLKILNLAKNELKYLPKHLFNNMTSLKNLSLADNEFTEVPDICGLPELEILNLHNNSITYIDFTSFCNLRRLNFIDLSANAFTNIVDGTFNQLSGLKILNLSWNRITKLPDNWIGSDATLKILRLDGNLFNDISDMSLGLLEHLEILSIGRNPMTNVTVRSLLTLPPNMTIDVSRLHDTQ